MAKTATAKTPTAPTHTPGPWRIEWPTHPDAMSEIFTHSVDDNWRIAYVMRDSNKHQQPIDDANARLIAAAPEMHAMLVDLQQSAIHGEPFDFVELRNLLSRISDVTK